MVSTETILFWLWNNNHHSYLWRFCNDRIIRRCIPDHEIQFVLHFYHASPTRGHLGAKRTWRWVLESGFYQSKISRDALNISSTCEQCHRCPSNLCYFVKYLMCEVLIIDLFPASFGFTYILLFIDYISKWVEAITWELIILNLLWILSDLISFIDAILKKYGVVHKVSTPYHPQTIGQAEISNKAIKKILKKMVKPSRKDWTHRLNDPPTTKFFVLKY